jgi:hypothetical protein
MPSRPEYIAGSNFSAGALTTEQQARREHGRLHNRFLHGWGVVCGLQVVPAGDPAMPWAIRICPGYAVSPCGDEIDLRCAVVVNIAEWIWALRTPAVAQPAEVLIAIRYATAEERTRIADCFRIDVLPVSEVPAPPPAVDLCSKAQVACSPTRPASAYVPLSVVELPQSPFLVITPANLSSVAPL